MTPTTTSVAGKMFNWLGPKYPQFHCVGRDCVKPKSMVSTPDGCPKDHVILMGKCRKIARRYWSGH